MSNSDSLRHPPIPAPHMLDSKTSAPYRVVRPEEVDERRTHPAGQSCVANPMLTATGLAKAYRKHQTSVPVLKGVDFSAERGKITAIIGQSGSGKSTLLHLLGTLDRPDEGRSLLMASGSIVYRVASAISSATNNSE